jgi:hypothetical protein
MAQTQSDWQSGRARRSRALGIPKDTGACASEAPGAAAHRRPALRREARDGEGRFRRPSRPRLDLPDCLDSWGYFSGFEVGQPLPTGETAPVFVTRSRWSPLLFFTKTF